MVDFAYQELLPLGEDTTPYRLLTADGVSTVETDAGTFLRVEPEVLTLLAREAMLEIAHFLRPATSPSSGGSSTTPRRRATTASSPSTC